MKRLLLTLLFFLPITLLWAQVPPPPDYHGNGTPGAPGGPLPLDQHVLCLIALAVIAGSYFIMKKQNTASHIN